MEGAFSTVRLAESRGLSEGNTRESRRNKRRRVAQRVQVLFAVQQTEDRFLARVAVDAFLVFPVVNACALMFHGLVAVI